MTEERKYRNESWLRDKYVKKQMKCSDIAELCGCNGTTIWRWLKKHQIETRTRGLSAEGKAADERLTDANWLRERYVNRRLKCSEIAELIGCSESAVQRWVNKHDIETEPYRYSVSDQRLTDPDWLYKQYIEHGRSGHEIAEECDCSSSVVYSWLRKHGIERRKRGHGSRLVGSDHPHWNGGESRYGRGWNESKRNAVRQRDGFCCQDPNCSVTQSQHIDEHGEKLHVHHLRKARDINDAEKRNAKENLITLCRNCHRRWEKIADAGLVPEVIADD